MIKINNLNKFYNKNKANQIHVINNTTLELPEVGLVALLGKSGSGKTTLLNVMSGLDSYDTGSINIDETTITKYNPDLWDSIRSKKIGYIFQNYYLLEDRTVYENLELSLKLSGLSDVSEIDKRIDYALSLVGLLKYKKRRPNTLSGGQQQRVGIARAIVKGPSIIIADEPTGNLDSDNTFDIMDMLKSISKKCLVVLVTHEESIANFFADRIIRLRDGIIYEDYLNDSQDDLNITDNKKIFLKDLKHKSNGNVDNITVNYNGDNKSNLTINIIEKEGRIYIDAKKSAMPITLIDDKSEVKVVDAHYEDKKKGAHKTIDIDNSILSKVTTDRQTNILDLFSIIKKSFLGYIRTPVKKKIISHALLFCLSVIMTIVMCTGVSSLHYDESLYEDNKNILNLNAAGDSISRDDLNNIDAHILISSYVYFQPLINNNFSNYYYFDSRYSDELSYASIFPVSYLNDSKVLYGSADLSLSNVAVIDVRTAKDALKALNNIGIIDIEFLIGERIMFNDELFEIKGIVDAGFKGIWINQSVRDEYIDTMFVDSVSSINIVTKDKATAKAWAKSKGISANDEFLNTINDFNLNRKYALLGILIYLTISILLMFAISSYTIKAGFANRIKEIGTYRCIGVKKRELLKEFILDNIFVLCFSVLIGVVLTASVFRNIPDNIREAFGSVSNNIFIFVGTLLFICGIYLGLTVFHVKVLLKLTPAEIMAKYDI